jgi:hypothetical protein
LRVGFGGLLAPYGASRLVPRKRFSIVRRHQASGFLVQEDEEAAVACQDPSELLFHLDKAFTIALQLQRPDLYFLHAASVARGGRAAILAAPAGTGKSTLTLALLREGFEYLSDELAPIDLSRLVVHPYPHALCLKAAPPAPYRLPRGTLATGARLHVPVTSLDARLHREPLPLAAIFFVRRATRRPVTCRPVTPAAAVAHLMSNALNRLAHADEGLDIALMLGRTVPCFELDSTDLDAARAAVGAVLERPLDGQLVAANAG